MKDSRRPVGDPGVGQQHVRAGRLLGQARERAAVAEIDRERARAELAGERLEQLRPAAREDELRAGLAEGPREGLPDAAGGAREQHRGAGDLHEL